MLPSTHKDSKRQDIHVLTVIFRINPKVNLSRLKTKNTNLKHKFSLDAIVFALRPHFSTLMEEGLNLRQCHTTLELPQSIFCHGLQRFTPKRELVHEI